MSDTEQQPALKRALGPFVVTKPALVARKRLAHSRGWFARFVADQPRRAGVSQPGGITAGFEAGLERLGAALA